MGSLRFGGLETLGAAHEVLSALPLGFLTHLLVGQQPGDQEGFAAYPARRRSRYRTYKAV